MRTIKTIVYQFGELTDEAKGKAREWCREGALDYDWWEDDGMLEMSLQEMKDRRMAKRPIDNTNPSIGSGNVLFSWKDIYFDIDREHYIQFIGLSVNDDETFRKLLRIDKRLWDKAHFSFDEKPGRHVNTRLVFEENDCEAEFTVREQGILERAEEIWSDRMEQAIINLRKDYEYQLSDECIDETIRANDYTFTADGRRFG